MSIKLPFGTFNPLGLEIASRRIRPSCADPSQPGKTYINSISGEHTPRTFRAMVPFLVRYLGRSSQGTLTRIIVPSRAPKEFYKRKQYYFKLCILVSLFYLSQIKVLDF